MEPRVGKWCAWPIVKRTIRLLLLEEKNKLKGIHQRATLTTIKWQDKKRYISDLFSAILQIIRSFHWRKDPQVIILTDSDSFRERDKSGLFFDVFFNDFLSGKGLQHPPFIIEDGMNWPHKNKVKGKRHLNAEILLLISEVLSYMPFVKSRVLKTAVDLVEILSKGGFPLEKRIVLNAVKRKLARFEGARICYSFVLKYRNSKALLLIDSNSRFGQIAAAKQHNIPVIELQHGVIGKDNAGYQWNKALFSNKRNIPLPDRILVFGKLWQDMLSQNGFWKKEEIQPVGSALIDQYRNFQKKRIKVPECIHILFTTDWTLSHRSIIFWKKFRNLVELHKTKMQYEVLIKPHPCETDYKTTYKSLTSSEKVNFNLLAGDESTYNAMLASDLHISFASTTLLESSGLGIPTVCIFGEHTNGKIEDLIGTNIFNDFILHVESPEDFADIVHKSNASPTFYNEWQQKTEADGKMIFQENFFMNSKKIINRHLHE